MLQWICVRAAYIGPRAAAGQLPSPAALAAAAADAGAAAAPSPGQSPNPIITLPAAALPAAIAPGPGAGPKLARPGGYAAAAPAANKDAALLDARGAAFKAEPNDKARMRIMANMNICWRKTQRLQLSTMWKLQSPQPPLTPTDAALQ